MTPPRDFGGKGIDMGKGGCPICGATQHVSPSALTPDTLYRHRITENRDCPEYEKCLTETAIEDAVMVPCISCPKRKGH